MLPSKIQAVYVNRIGWAQDALKQVAKDDPLYGLSHMVLVLAWIQLGDTSAARDELATVTEVIDATLPKLEDGRVDPRFVMRSQKLRHEWLIAEILRREAEASLEKNMSIIEGRNRDSGSQ